MKRVFLGGTCNKSTWRESLKKQLKLKYYDPCGETWTPEMQAEELKQREECDFCLYVLTPKMTGFYSVAEIVDDSNKRPGKTIFCYLTEDDQEHFSEFQIKSLDNVAEMVKRNGAYYFKTLKEVGNFLNHQ